MASLVARNTSLSLTHLGKHPPGKACTGITSGLPTILNLSGQTTQKGLFYWGFAGLSAVVVTCRVAPCVVLRALDFVGTETGASSQHHFFPVGTFCFNSSNQFSTTLICVGGASVCSVGLSIRNRWPSADTS